MNSLHENSKEKLKNTLLIKAISVWLIIGLVVQVLTYYSLFNWGAIWHIPFWPLIAIVHTIKSVLFFLMIILIGCASTWFLLKIKK